MSNGYEQADAVAAIVKQANDIVIIQADNPDGDSMASSLALEQILGDLGKNTHLYCGVDIPSYLRYLPGWDRTSKDIPKKFDAAIIVDTSTETLLEQLEKTQQKPWVASKPVIVLDHHDVDQSISFARAVVRPKAVATGEVIYELASQLDWTLNLQAKNMVAVSILADSQGLMTDATSARTIHIVAELVGAGVSLPELDSMRRELMRKSPTLNTYKGQLLQRIEYHADNRIATITIPWDEIEKYSPFYNPSMLVLDDMRLTEGTDVAIAFKVYKDGRVTAKIRANYGKKIAGALAEHFGGGGHPYASGFKIRDGRSFEDIKQECISEALRLLDELSLSQ